MSIRDSFEELVDKDALKIIFSFVHYEQWMPFAFVSKRWRRTIRQINDSPWLGYGLQTKEFVKKKVKTSYYSSVAGEAGHFDLLKWCRREGCPWNSDSGCGFAKFGDLEMLIWAENNGCQLIPKMISSAAESGKLEIIKYLRDKGIGWDKLSENWKS
eukprot:TRINITY_DN6336_c0_g1_i1.p1 TRINITY_DN6336_c0_g1~~TRINITY_DN6336_c0_g1_i1.p1  ORF type:complete len:157 (-),score=37.89 TRINITY_DN6336_c0_g1_i1:44-514(-)